IAEVGVQRLKPIRQFDRCLALSIGRDIAGVDVHHLRRFDRSVNQVFVCWIQRMVDLEVLGASSDRTSDLYVAGEIPGVTRSSATVIAIDGVAVVVGDAVYAIASSRRRMVLAV